MQSCFLLEPNFTVCSLPVMSLGARRAWRDIAGREQTVKSGACNKHGPRGLTSLELVMNPLVLPFAEFHRRLSEVFGEAPLGRYDGAYGDQFKYPEVYSAAARKRLEEFLDGKNNFTTVLYSIPYLDRWTLVRRLQYGENKRHHS